MSRRRARARSVPGRGKANKTEAAWARVLEARKLAGELLWYGFEPVRLRLGSNCHYTPDFGWVDVDGVFGFDEIKGSGGWVHEDGRIKFKWAGEVFPFFVFRAIVRKRSGGWDLEEYKPVGPWPTEPTQ